MSSARRFRGYTVENKNRQFMEFMLSGKPSTAPQDGYDFFIRHYRDGVTMRQLAQEAGLSYEQLRSRIFDAERAGMNEFALGVCPCCNGTGLKPDEEG